MRRVLLRGDAAEVALVASTVEAGVGIDGFAPESTHRQAEAIVRARDGRQVEDDGHPPGAIAALAHEGQHAVVGVAAVDPEKT